MEAVQDTADFSTLAFGIAALPGKVRGGLETGTDLGVGKPAQSVRAVHEGVKQLKLLACQWVEGLGGATTG